MPDTHPLIAREGWLHVGLALVVALLATRFLHWGALPFWAIAVFVVQFFRDPHRVPTPVADGGVLAAADGRVVVVGRARDPWLDRDALKISVFMNVFNVHSNRSPVSGEVRQTWYHAGRFLNAALDKASVENERSALWLRTPRGDDVTCVQIAGLIARRVLCYARQGQRLAAGERYGFIRFGSRVDLYLHPDARARVSVGDKVSAGITVLAELPAS
ncbi:MAG: phosphatidylserine decarboxylase [Burkholderiales bacterium]|nr:phosphatidylserine decarboxylase [Burkholderiales bacterium]